MSRKPLPRNLRQAEPACFYEHPRWAKVCGRVRSHRIHGIRPDGLYAEYEYSGPERHRFVPGPEARLALYAVNRLPDYETAVEAAWALIVALDNPHLEVVGPATENARAALARLRSNDPGARGATE